MASNSQSVTTTVAAPGAGAASESLSTQTPERAHRQLPWWKDAVVYQVYPRSFADSNGDGMGDLPGITSRLAYLKALGVDAVWCSPFYPSPMADAGYDVADYRDIDPVFGTLDDADELIARAHELGLKVIIDLVPNHTSSEHAWFKAAVAAGPGSPERERYIFREGRGENGEWPPNNWISNFHGPAWTRLDDGWWYLHMFDSKQPDLNWENPEVGDEFESVLRFWCDRGVDGFRIDVAHGLVKVPGLPDADWSYSEANNTGRLPMWDQEGVHEIYRRWRRVLDEYNPGGDPNGDRILVAEAWVEPLERAARYVRPDEMHHGFGFTYLTRPWDASAICEAVRHTLEANGAEGAISTWVLSNHDVVRHRSRFGYRDVAVTGGRRPIGPDDPQPDLDLGLARARAASTFMLALPGAAYLYQGEELGLPEVVDIAPEQRQDPNWHRTAGEHIGRDGCRVPIPWNSDAPAYGFNDTGKAWLPQPPIFGELAPDRQEGVPGSTLELYRELLRLRREYRLGESELEPLTLSEHGTPDVAAFLSVGPVAKVALVLNVGDTPVPLPAGETLVNSVGGAGAKGLTDRQLPGNAAAWVKVTDTAATHTATGEAR